MEIRRRMRRRILVLAGLGTLALLAGPVRSRAIEDDGARQTQAQSLAANGDFTGETGARDASGTTPVTKEERELARVAVIDTSLLLILITGMGLIVAYTTVATRRRDLQPVLRDRVAAGMSYGPASGVASR